MQKQESDLQNSDSIKVPLIENSENNAEQQKSQINEIEVQLPADIQEEGIIKSIQGYKYSDWKSITTYLLCILTGGLLYLLQRWEIKIRIALFMRKCSIKDAQFLKVTAGDNSIDLIPMDVQQFTINNMVKLYKVFQFRLYKYYLDLSKKKFVPIEFNIFNLSNNKLHEIYGAGITSETKYQSQLSLFGKNNTEIPEKTTGKIFIDEILSPFYIFQAASVLIWVLESYYFYSGVILITSIISIVVTLVETRRNYIKLREMSFYETQVNVYRGYKRTESNNSDGQSQFTEQINNCKRQISSLELVPGDIIEVPENRNMPCDLILLNGSAVMNESMLTGESIPVLKNSLPFNNVLYNPNEEGKQSTLFAGTFCIETRFHMKGKIPILGMVSKTSFSTVKGSLVRSILYPKQLTFSFYADSMKFIGIMASMSVVGYLISLSSIIEGTKEGFMNIFGLLLRCLDLITITVPPALPTCLSIGISFAMQRLKQYQIFCISPNKVNVAGKVQIMCFDKTGTLTEDGLNMYGVRPIKIKDGKVHFGYLSKTPANLWQMNKKIVKPQLNEEQTQIYQDLLDFGDLDNLFVEIMASCHSLTVVQNKLIGDPLEIIMFQYSKWILQEQIEDKFDELVLAIVKPNADQELKNENVAILKRFEFSARLQRMSDIVKKMNENFYRLHVKGSPEKIQELCIKSSIPQNFHEVLDFYAQKGFRILAFAIKKLEANFKKLDKLEREDIEKDLYFMGFLIMENKLKDITTSTIIELQKANIRNIMITGDNVLTAISVARQCNIVPYDKSPRVYLGDVVTDEQGKEKLVWIDHEMSNKVMDDELDPQDRVEENKKKAMLDANMNSELDSEEQIFEEKREKAIQNRYDINLDVDDENDKQDDPVKENQQINVGRSQSIWMEHENYCLALTGKAFRLLVDQKNTKDERAIRRFKAMLQRGQVFARMKPEDKSQLIQELQQSDEKPQCGMCGDGANDCGALKAADVGVSLSEAEASIAAPFTSKVQDIRCVVTLLKEGRCALVTSFQCFKYMVLYSMIQFGTTTILYFVLSQPADLQFLYWDLFLVIPLAFLMGITKPHQTLSKQVPGSKLLSFDVLLSVLGETFTQIAVQAGVFLYLIHQKWFIPCKEVHNEDHLNDKIPSGNEIQHCYEPMTLFWISNFQYIATALSFSIGKPWRQPFHKNLPFTIAFVIINLITIFIQLFPPAFIAKVLLYLKKVYNTKTQQWDSIMPSSWPYIMLCIAAVNFVLTYLYEKYMVGLICRARLRYKNLKKLQ